MSDKETKAIKTFVSKLREQGVTIQNINESAADSNKHFSYTESGDIERLYESLGKPAGRSLRIKSENEYWKPAADTSKSESSDSK